MKKINTKYTLGYGNLIILIMAVIAIIIFSYVFYIQKVNKEEEKIVENKCLEVVMDDESLENGITLNKNNIVKQSDIDKLGTYNFTVKNNCNNYVEYNLNLESIYKKGAKKGDYLTADLVNVSLLDKQSSLSNLPQAELLLDSGLSYEAYNLINDALNPKEKKKYNLKLWLSEDAQNSNKNYIGKIVVYGQAKNIAFNDYLLSSDIANELSYQESELEKASEQTINNTNKYCYAKSYLVNADLFMLNGDIKCDVYSDKLYEDGYLFTLKKLNKYNVGSKLYQVKKLTKNELNVNSYTVFKESSFNKLNDNVQGLIKYNDNYYYAGNKVDNYVQIDGDKQLYRIVGLYLQEDNTYFVKLTLSKPMDKKYYFLGGNKEGAKNVCGNDNNSKCNKPLNSYSNSYLNTILNKKEEKFISENNFNIGATLTNLTPYNSFILENTKQMKLNKGLLTINDYALTTEVTNWNYSIENINFNSSWLNLTEDEFSLTPNLIYDNDILVLNEKNVDSISVINSQKMFVRPSFYLTPNIKLVAGNGKKNNPFILTI